MRDRTVHLLKVGEVKQMSDNDRLERKRYMGVWRWESVMMARMMWKNM